MHNRRRFIDNWSCLLHYPLCCGDRGVHVGFVVQAGGGGGAVDNWRVGVRPVAQTGGSAVVGFVPVAAPGGRFCGVDEVPTAGQGVAVRAAAVVPAGGGRRRVDVLLVQAGRADTTRAGLRPHSGVGARPVVVLRHLAGAGGAAGRPGLFAQPSHVAGRGRDFHRPPGAGTGTGAVRFSADLDGGRSLPLSGPARPGAGAELVPVGPVEPPDGRGHGHSPLPVGRSQLPADEVLEGQRRATRSGPVGESQKRGGKATPGTPFRQAPQTRSGDPVLSRCPGRPSATSIAAPRVGALAGGPATNGRGSESAPRSAAAEPAMALDPLETGRYPRSTRQAQRGRGALPRGI